MTPEAWVVLHYWREPSSDGQSRKLQPSCEALLLQPKSVMPALETYAGGSDDTIFHGVCGAEDDGDKQWFVFWEEEGQGRYEDITQLKEAPAGYFRVILIEPDQAEDWKVIQWLPHMRSLYSSRMFNECDVFDVHLLTPGEVEEVFGYWRTQFMQKGAVSIVDNCSFAPPRAVDELPTVRANWGWHTNEHP